jgi:Protein of unknown function (DUF3099)
VCPRPRTLVPAPGRPRRHAATAPRLGGARRQPGLDAPPPGRVRRLIRGRPGIGTLMASSGQNQDEPAGPRPSRRDKRVYLVLMTVCIGLFVLSWAVLDRYSATAAIIVSAVALVIPPFAVIIANAAGAADRRRP